MSAEIPRHGAGVPSRGRSARAELRARAARAFAGAALALVPACAGIPDLPVPNHVGLNDRLSLGGGAYLASTSTQVRLDSEVLGVGALIDLEESMDLEDQKAVPFGLARVRFDDRWRAEFEYFQMRRQSSGTLEVEVQWGDQVFPVNTGLEALFDIDLARFSIGYAFFRRRDKELGLALGVHVARVEASLVDEDGDGDLGELLAPLPVASLYGAIALTDVWLLSMRVDAFSLEYDPYSGRLLSHGVDLLCQPFRHVGFGVGWRNLLVDIEADDGDYRGKIESDFSGPIAYLSVNF